MVKYCSKCGARALPGARFCRSCGNRLEKNTADSEDQVEAQQEEVYDSYEDSRYEPTPVKVELSKDEEDSLLILSNIIPLQKKIEELKKNKDDLEIKFRVEEEISEKDYNSESKKIDSEITKLEAEIADKRKVMASVTLINLVQEVVEMRERQEKLEEIFFH